MPEIIPIHTVPLARFVLDRGKGPPMADADFLETSGPTIARRAFMAVRAAAPDLEEKRHPSNVPGYSIAHDGENWTNGTIVVWDDATGIVVGGQAHGVPYVMPEYRGRNLGREIQLCAFQTGLKTINDPSFFSPDGLAARKAAHRFAVERAVEEGFEVSDEVLADYPHLRETVPSL